MGEVAALSGWSVPWLCSVIHFWTLALESLPLQPFLLQSRSHFSCVKSLRAFARLWVSTITPLWGILSSNLKFSKEDALKGKHFAMYFLKLGDIEDCVLLMSGKINGEYGPISDIWELNYYCFNPGECCYLWDWPELLEFARKVICKFLMDQT